MSCRIIDAYSVLTVGITFEHKMLSHFEQCHVTHRLLVKVTTRILFVRIPVGILGFHQVQSIFWSVVSYDCVRYIGPRVKVSDDTICVAHYANASNERRNGTC